MRYILFIFFISILFACEKQTEEDQNINQPSFVCDIDGNSFSASTFGATINQFDMMSLDFSDNTYDVSLRIYNFSDINANDTVYFSTPGMGMVIYNGITYSNFYNPPYDGRLIFTDMDVSSLSGTLYFKAQDVDPMSFVNVNVTNGLFQNINY